MMNGTIVKIHGNSGSGKTTIVRNLFEQSSSVNAIPTADHKKVEAYIVSLPGVQLPIYILGSYENTCGGVDTIPSTDILIDLIEKYAPSGNVIYEGLLVSTYFGAAGKAVHKYGDRHVWAFLDTPLETCIERVKARRIEAGNLTPLNEDNTRNRQKPIAALARKLTNAGYNVVTLNHSEDPTEQVIKVLI